MIRSRYKKFIAGFTTTLVLFFTLYTFARAQDLSKVVQKDNLHPKLQSSLAKLANEYKQGVSAAQVFAKSRQINMDAQEKITVYLISEPGVSIDEAALRALGVEIIKRADNVAKVKTPVNMLESIADTIDGISFIKRPVKLMKSAVQSEGVNLTGAAAFHAAGYTGTDVNIAVIDLGFQFLSSAISDGELPGNVVLVDCTGVSCVEVADFPSDTDPHGTGVAEIVFDMAPDAQIYLIKITDTLDLWRAKDYAINNRIDIINHSLIVANTNFYDGQCFHLYPVCTVNDAYSNGILWVNAAGNEAHRHYEATFTDSDSNGWHNVSGTDETIQITAQPGQVIKLYLTWDAWGTTGSTDQDYDLYLYDSSSNEVDSSLARGIQEPSEEIVYTVPNSVPVNSTYFILIKKFSASSNHQLELYSELQSLTPSVTSSSLLSPADAANALAVGAIDYLNWTTGPTESYSSQGPTNDGRTKPDISGPDFVSNYVYGLFPGTSASSPHVSGAAALLLSKSPSFSVSQLWNALTSSAIDMGSSGKDNLYGYGRLNLDLSPGSGGGGISTGGGGGGGGGSGCFIATAAFGSPMEPHVQILREFRDRFLLNNTVGKIFLSLYKTHSPPVADVIARHSTIKTIVRISLLPVVGISWVVLELGPVPVFLFILFVCLGLIRYKKWIISNRAEVIRKGFKEPRVQGFE